MISPMGDSRTSRAATVPGNTYFGGVVLEGADGADGASVYNLYYIAKGSNDTAVRTRQGDHTFKNSHTFKLTLCCLFFRPLFSSYFLGRQLGLLMSVVELVFQPGRKLVGCLV